MSRTVRTETARWAPLVVRMTIAAASLTLLGSCAKPERSVPPQHLADTGLYADFATRRVSDAALPFAPQYPLWTDGAEKQRWIALPRGTSIDASDADHWRFPVGTRLWKQFSFGRPVETRFMELQPDGTWLYATYLWCADGSDAVLAPDAGVPRAIATRDGQHHDLPSILDCRSCHEGGRTPVLGFSALQLSSDRDPNAPHAVAAQPDDVDLPALVERGLIDGLPSPWRDVPPRIAARTPRERTALGYLFGNCSSCHNADGPLHRLGLRFDHPLAASTPPALTTAVGVRSEYALRGVDLRIAAGDADHSLVQRRLATTDPLLQMPPFGRHLADRDAVDLIADWVEHDLAAANTALTVPTDQSKRRP